MSGASPSHSAWQKNMGPPSLSTTDTLLISRGLSTTIQSRFVARGTPNDDYSLGFVCVAAGTTFSGSFSAGLSAAITTIDVRGKANFLPNSSMTFN